MLFTVRDYNKVPVSISKETWFNKLLNPKSGHPEIEPYFQELRRAIQSPDFVYQSVKLPNSKLFIKKGVGKGKFKNDFLVIVVKYVKE